MAETPTDRRLTAWETHFSTISTALILAAIMFTGGTLYKFGNQLTEFSVTMAFQTAKLAELSAEIKSSRETQVTRQDFVELRDRVRSNEREITLLKDKARR